MNFPFLLLQSALFYLISCLFFSAMKVQSHTSLLFLVCNREKESVLGGRGGVENKKVKSFNFHYLEKKNKSYESGCQPCCLLNLKFSEERAISRASASLTLSSLPMFKNKHCLKIMSLILYMT